MVSRRGTDSVPVQKSNFVPVPPIELGHEPTPDLEYEHDYQLPEVPLWDQEEPYMPRSVKLADDRETQLARSARHDRVREPLPAETRSGKYGKGECEVVLSPLTSCLDVIWSRRC